MKKNSENGSVLIGLLLSLGIAAFIYVGTSTSFFNFIARQKSKNQLEILSKSFTNAVFNYTAYALKERWCMDENWGRDKNCGTTDTTDMKAVVTHSRNLERFLWSKVTVNEMGSRYQVLYGEAPPNLSLSKIEQTIQMTSLESLGDSHPLNLVLDDKIKKCLASISVSIEKPLSNQYKSQGDEVYLVVTVKGNLSKNPLARCDLISNTPVLKGLVIVYPKTLNQYALMKLGNFKISDYANKSKGKGLQFFGPVYVQKDVTLPSKGNYSVSFKEKVRIGDGIIRTEGKAFTPKTPGGFSDQYLSQIATMDGFLNGVSLEAEPDLGMSRLFGPSYNYPDNVNMAKCSERQPLKDTYSLTRNSRLWVKGSNGNYSFTLSEKNEFREYIRHGSNSSDKYIYYKPSDQFVKALKEDTYIVNIYEVKVEEESNSSKPIMEAKVSVNGVEYSTVYLGRNSEARISFGNKDFFKTQRDKLDISETTPLDLSSINQKGMNINGDLNNHFYNFEEACNKAKDKDIGIPECSKVIGEKNKFTTETDCSLLAEPDKINNCNDRLSELKNAKSKYFKTEKDLVNDLNNFLSNIPSVVIKTKEVLSNKEDVEIIWDNKDSLKYPFVDMVNKIKFKFNVYDFAIEDSHDTTSGKRDGKNKRLPGPNAEGTGNENSIVYDIIKNDEGEFSKFLIKKSDGSILDAKDSKGTTLQAWKEGYSNPEPPGNKPGEDEISYPVDGPTVAEAKKLDKECDIDTTVIPPPGWDVSFTDHTQFSWLYNVTNSGITITNPAKVQPMPTYVFTKVDMDVGNYQGVPTRSIVQECIVPNSIDFVFGFYVCETLTVQSRNRPLDLVGTFVVKNLNIDSSALISGVNFYSIWSAGGIKLLKDNKHLRREKGTSQECTFDQPGWFKGLSEDVLADYQSCSPAKFLYQGANNFNWTTIDPEIGITNGASQVTTLSKVTNRYRRYGVSVVWLRNGIE